MAMEPHEIARVNAMLQKLDAVERKLDYLFRHFNVPYVEQRPPPDEIEQAILRGDRIAAMKLFQSRSGADLAAAKRAIDDLAARLGV